MKYCLSILALSLTLNAISQSICGIANEGGSVTLTAPAGKVFISVTFASYGTPNGTCGSFTIGGCHATNSQDIVEAALLNNNSATIDASNAVFGDPCGGTVKRLYIEAVYGNVLPLNLTSFSCSSNSNSNTLRWQTSNEINTHSFYIERSTDGRNFSVIGSVPSVNSNGTNQYSYIDNTIEREAYYYRLKMMDRDGSFSFSSIIKTKLSLTRDLNIFPNPVTNTTSISGLSGTGYIEVIGLQGTSLKQITVTGNTQIIDLADCPAGIYILKYVTNQNTKYVKVVKQ